MEIKELLLVPHRKKTAIVEYSLIHQAKQGAGHGISVPNPTVTGLSRIKIEFASSRRQSPYVELQKSIPASKLEIVFALNPVHGIVQLEDIVGKFRVTTVVDLVITAKPLDAGKSVLIHAREANLCGISLTEAVRNLAAEAPAKSKQELIHHGWVEDIVVAESRIPCILGRARPKDVRQTGNAPSLSIVVVKATRNPMFVGEDLVDLDIDKIRGGTGDAAVGHVIIQVAIRTGKQSKNFRHHRARRKIGIVG